MLEPINFLSDEQLPIQKPPWNRKKVVFLLLTGILVFTFGLRIAGSAREEKNNDPLHYDPITLEPKKPKSLLKKLSYVVFNRNDEKLAGRSDDRINLLLIGIGGPGHDGPYLTDTIMIASIKPSTNQIALISIPRDLAVRIPGYGIQKINHANAYGEIKQTDWGGALATEITSKTFAIEIPYYLRIDFKAFVDIIDEVGGIKINVERSFTDYTYPAPGGLYQTVSFNQGVNNLDGNTALKYVRSRHGNNGEGSDFARARRQQQILLALKEKVASYGALLNPVRLNSIMNSLESHITTNLEFGELVTLAKISKQLRTNEIISLVLDSSQDGYLQNSFTSTGAFMLEPVGGDFTRINKTIENIFENSGQKLSNAPLQDNPVFTDVSIEIQNGAWNAGLATRIRKRLSNKNFQITTVGNANEKPVSESGIYQVSPKQNNDVMRALVNEMQIPIKEKIPGSITPSTSTDILILLGSDFVD